MAQVVEHLSVAELQTRYAACEDVTSARRFQAIWLLMKGHSTREVAGSLRSGGVGSSSFSNAITRLERKLWSISEGAAVRRASWRTSVTR
jgi:transposase